MTDSAREPADQPIDSPAANTAEGAGIYALATHLLIEARYDRDAATIALIEAINREDALRAEAVRIVARQLINSVTGSQRARLKGHVSPAGPNRFDRANDLRAMQDNWLLTYVLPNKIVLGEAVHSDLKNAIEVHHKNELGERSSRKFLEAIGKALPAGKCVREAFTSAQIQRIWRDSK